MLAFATQIRSKIYAFNISPHVSLTVSYLVFSTLWIILSDNLALKIAGTDLKLFQEIQGIKGLVFVIVSSILLFFLSRKFYTNLRTYSAKTESIEKKFTALNEAAREGIFDCDLETMTARVNNKMKFFVPTENNVITDFWNYYQKRMHPADQKRILQEYEDILKTDRTTWQIEYRLLGKDNKYYSVISSVYIIRNFCNNAPARLIGTIQDVSDLRNLQMEYYEQQLKYKQEISRSIIRTEEKERERWATELHDNICQILSVANLYLSEMIIHKENISQLLPDTKKLVVQSMDEIRHLSASLTPPAFSETSLFGALEKLVCNITRVKPIILKLDVDQLNEEILNDEQQLLIYRIVQEQVNNILKYAKATEATINISSCDNFVTLKVIDNGKGFDPKTVKSGLGLNNIRTRLQVYKGGLDIQSSPGEGCSLTATIKV